MRYLIAAALMLCACRGRTGMMTGRVHGVAHVTPQLCADHVVVDVAGTKIVAKDAYDIHTAEVAALAGMMVRVQFIAHLWALCSPAVEATSIAMAGPEPYLPPSPANSPEL